MNSGTKDAKSYIDSGTPFTVSSLIQRYFVNEMRNSNMQSTIIDSAKYNDII